MRWFLLCAVAISLICSTSVSAQQTDTVEGVSPVGSLNLRFESTTLRLSVDFQDHNGNQALDAEESASILVRIINDGPGKAYRVQVQGRMVQSSSQIVLSGLNTQLGTLQDGDTRQQSMTIRGTDQLDDGFVVVRIDAQDAYGRRAQPVDLRIPTRALVPPLLRVADSGIDDDNEGNSYGNANRRIEKGETIEIKALVQNQGQGLAEAVTVDVRPPEGVFYVGRQKINLGDLEPGAYRPIDFAFTVPPSYAGDDKLVFAIEIGEARGRFGHRDVLQYTLNQVARDRQIIQVKEVTIQEHQTNPIAIPQVPSLSIDVDTDIPQGSVQRPDAVAVVIGNRSYAAYHGDVPDVDFALQDAAIVKEYLVKTLGYREGNILYYNDAPLATFRSVFGTRDAPEGRLAYLVKPERSDVFIYYSGHGAPDVDQKQGYFVPVDCAPDEVKINGYPLELFYQNLSRIAARSVTVVIDACFTGGSEKGMLIRRASPVGIFIDDPAMQLRNGLVFTSSSGEQISSWYPEKKHGLFTYFFLKGLQGHADQDRDGRITAGELHAFVSDSSDGVPYWARRLHNGRRQTPGLLGDEYRVILESSR